MFAFSEYCRVLSIWISNFVQHRLHVCLVIISLRMWRQMAQKAAARVGVRGVLQNNCSIARICSNTNITSEQFFVRVPRMVPRQDAGNTLHITATRSSLTPGKLLSWGSGNPPYLSDNILSTQRKIFSKCTLSSTSWRPVLYPVFFVGSYDGREEEKRVTYRAAGSGRGARVSAVCPDQRSLGGK